MATRSTVRYTKHRQQAAVRRRRIVLLLVLATALVVVGGAMAWPRGEDPASSQVALVPAKAKANDKAKNNANGNGNGNAQQPADEGEAAVAAGARKCYTIVLRNCSCFTSACGGGGASDRRIKNNQEKFLKPKNGFD